MYWLFVCFLGSLRRIINCFKTFCRHILRGKWARLGWIYFGCWYGWFLRLTLSSLQGRHWGLLYEVNVPGNWYFNLMSMIHTLTFSSLCLSLILLISISLLLFCFDGSTSLSFYYQIKYLAQKWMLYKLNYYYLRITWKSFTLPSFRIRRL